VPQSELRLVKRIAEFVRKERVTDLPRRRRGIYVLYKKRRPLNHAGKRRERYDVVYVGMATAGRGGGMRHRLSSHARSETRGDHWTHFSAFEVWDNIRDDEIAGLEGLFRHIYGKVANALNLQKGFKKAKRVRINTSENGTRDSLCRAPQVGRAAASGNPRTLSSPAPRMLCGSILVSAP
jgi:hypothetical protein